MTQTQTPWESTQIALFYEGEPYLAIDITPEMLEDAIAAERPPTDNDNAVRTWLITSMNQLRDDVALIRDHSEEVFLVPERRDRMICKAILLMQYLLVSKQQRLSSVAAVALYLKAGQSPYEADVPAFRLAVLSKPLSHEEFSAMSTARHSYVGSGDSIDEILPNQARSPASPLPPSKSSKDRSTTRACIAVQAFWHNDKPGGFAVGIEAPEQSEVSLDAEMEALDQIVMSLAQTKPSARDTDRYLRFMARQPGILHPDMNNVGHRITVFETMAAVAYAEEAGHLHSDEYNGMVYIYRIGEDGAFIDRKDQPQRPMWR